MFYNLFDRNIKREGDPDNWQADISKLKALGYRQNYSMKEGLKRYYKWVKQQEDE